MRYGEIALFKFSGALSLAVSGQSLHDELGKKNVDDLPLVDHLIDALHNSLLNGDAPIPITQFGRRRIGEFIEHGVAHLIDFLIALDFACRGL